MIFLNFQFTTNNMLMEIIVSGERDVKDAEAINLESAKITDITRLQCNYLQMSKPVYI